MPVNRVSTGHFVAGVSTAKQVFLTDGTIRHVLAGLAIVIVEQLAVNAHTAVVTVGKVFSATHSAETTVRAVIRGLGFGHPEVANEAVVLAKLNTTTNAFVAVKRE